MTTNAPQEMTWERCLRIIRDNISPLTYKTWFEPIKPIQLEGDQLTIQVPSQFFYEWLEEHYYTIIQRSLENVIGPKAKLIYRAVVEDGKEPPVQDKSELEPPPPSILANTPHPPDRSPSSRGTWKAPGYSVLVPRYTFESFVKGEECNAFAYAACIAVANNPGKPCLTRWSFMAA